MENLDFDHVSYSRQDETVVATLMRNVYVWMTLALIITGFCALLTAKSMTLLTLIFSNALVFYGLIIAELALVWILSLCINKLSFATATLMFILYSIINGVTLSSIFVVYELSSIATTFFITAGAFAGLAIVGTTTKKDLSAIGKFCYMALFGLILAMLVNLFLRNSMMDLVVSCVGVLIFSGLTAYDSQKIKQILEQADDVDDSMMKIALMGSLTLYLDFINLFLQLLRLFGSRR